MRTKFAAAAAAAMVLSRRGEEERREEGKRKKRKGEDRCGVKDPKPLVKDRSSIRQELKEGV
jgi:hypothetical protein